MDCWVFQPRIDIFSGSDGTKVLDVKLMANSLGGFLDFNRLSTISVVADIFIN